MKERKIETAVFAGGCFWCTEAIFSRLKGVFSVIPGYAGGTKENPTYREVSSGTTGHAEAVQIEYNPTEISFNDLLAVFFSTHDPTTVNRQGSDSGEQYRSSIFYTAGEQKAAAEKFIGDLQKEGVFSKNIVTRIEPLIKFYSAEDYHRRYYEMNRSAPYCQVVIAPKIEKLNARYQALIKK